MRLVMTPPMLNLLDQPHREAARLVKSGAPVFLTVNPVEYHGPHLSLHNDRLVSQGLCRDLHARIAPQAPFLLGADLEVGVDPCPGRGSRHVPFQTVRALVVEACRALAELGAQQVILMTFHGAPLHAIALEAGVELLESRGVRALAPFNAVVQELLALDASRYAPALEPIADPAERAEVAAGLAMDFHAGFFETSMALHYAPGSVSPEFATLPPCPPFAAPAHMALVGRAARRLGLAHFAGEVGFASAAFGWYALRPFPGYTGRPHLANPVSGARFASAIVDRYAELAGEVFGRGARSPAPIMRWSKALTLGGRVGSPSLPEREVARMA